MCLVGLRVGVSSGVVSCCGVCVLIVVWKSSGGWTFFLRSGVREVPEEGLSSWHSSRSSRMSCVDSSVAWDPLHLGRSSGVCWKEVTSRGVEDEGMMSSCVGGGEWMSSGGGEEGG